MNLFHLFPLVLSDSSNRGIFVLPIFLFPLFSWKSNDPSLNQYFFLSLLFLTLDLQVRFDFSKDLSSLGLDLRITEIAV